MPPRLNAAVSGILPQEIRKDIARIVFPCIFAIIFLFLLPGSVRTAAADWRPLVERLAVDGFNRSVMEALFIRPEVRFEPDAMAEKIKTLVRTQSSPDSLVARLKNAVRRDYLGNWVIARARSYMLENLVVLEEIDALYGVPKEVVVSILLIETHLGRNTGNRCVFNRLASMALSADLETVRPHLGGGLLTSENEEFARRRCREKGDWAYNELKALLRLAERDGLDPLGIRGSIYGAIGLCQFMPSNVFIYGVDADQDGRVDPFTKTDALHSIANYLRGHGWRPGMDRVGQHRIIFDYNHSTVYANTVLAVAQRLRDRSRTRP
ncbi:MAG: lytic murein transglycosylase [Deltaproteobacteria bacterium]|nr:lytic murein transglycosylase [Deltaproteobacteria bacterium]